MRPAAAPLSVRGNPAVSHLTFISVRVLSRCGSLTCGFVLLKCGFWALAGAVAVGLAGAVCADGEDVAKCHGGADRVLLSPRVAAGYAVARHLRNTRSLDVRTCHVLQEFHLPEHGATLPLAPSLA